MTKFYKMQNMVRDQTKNSSCEQNSFFFGSKVDGIIQLADRNEVAIIVK